MPKNTVPRSRRAAAPNKYPKTVKNAKQLQAKWTGEEYEARKARLAASLDLKDLSDLERAFLATCQKIRRRDRGCESPFEEFFDSLTIMVEVGKWPTPDDVAHELARFREHFEFMRESTRNFIAAYPEKPAAPESEHAA